MFLADETAMELIMCCAASEDGGPIGEFRSIGGLYGVFELRLGSGNAMGDNDPRDGGDVISSPLDPPDSIIWSTFINIGLTPRKGCCDGK